MDLESLFNLQLREFEARTEMYRSKMTKMYSNVFESGSFDDKIHALWDTWPLAHQVQFLKVAYDKLETISSLTIQIEVRNTK